ncbi:MAG: hypothetical protein JWQ72_3623, partial [Polaromonas sp.]|nr:hypothetical protein [Polaromonas sp.]
MNAGFTDRHDVLFLDGDQLVHIGDKTVRELLNVVVGAALVVFRCQFVLDQLLDVVVGVPAQVADGHLGMFAFGADHLGELLAALFGHGRHRHADEVTLRRRVQPEIGITYGFLDLGAHAFFPWRNPDGSRIQQGHVGHLA